MSDFDITPPPEPKRKSGFLKRLLFKEQDDAAKIDEIKRKIGLDEPAPAPDLEDIKQKLGLSEETLPTPEPREEQPEPYTPTQKVEIHDWTQDAHPTTQEEETPWTQESASPIQDAPSEELPDASFESHDDEPDFGTPLHHEAVDEHLAPFEKQQARIEEKLQSVEPRPDLPEWKFQDKEITPDQYFILHHGQPIKSLKDFIDALEYVDDSTFSHHVNEYRNDFANWIRDVINDNDLADQIQPVQSRDEMIKILLAHEKAVAKRVEKEHGKIKQVVAKQEQTVKRLQKVDQSIEDLRSQLEQKTRELTAERKAKESLIKSKLDAEVKRRLDVQKKALIDARQQLATAKKEYETKSKELDTRIKSLGEREKSILLQEQKNRALLDDVKEERAHLAKEKKEAHTLLKDANTIRKHWEEMKKLDVQTKQNIDAITKREIEISRHEETIRQRERKIASDLTRLHEEQERLKAAKEEHAKREAEVKRGEAEGRKIMLESEARAKEAIELERTSREKIKADMKRLETLRKQIDASLAKALKNKQKISTAVALRKHLEENFAKARDTVVSERKEMEQKGYDTLVKARVDTTPIGQPDVSHAEDVIDVNKKQLPLYSKVEECRSALDRGDLESAKRLYAELRNEFTVAKLAADEKNMLYTSIRELYDDIHLAMLG